MLFGGGHCGVVWGIGFGVWGFWGSSKNIQSYRGVHKPGSQYSPAIYTMDIAYKIDIPLYIFDRYITGI